MRMSLQIKRHAAFFGKISLFFLLSTVQIVIWESSFSPGKIFFSVLLSRFLPLHLQAGIFLNKDLVFGQGWATQLSEVTLCHFAIFF